MLLLVEGPAAPSVGNEGAVVRASQVGRQHGQHHLFASDIVAQTRDLYG